MVRANEELDERITLAEVRRHYESALENTPTLEDSQQFKLGFLIGFRLYERMAIMLGKAVTEDESRRVVTIKKS